MTDYFPVVFLEYHSTVLTWKAENRAMAAKSTDLKTFLKRTSLQWCRQAQFSTQIPISKATAACPYTISKLYCCHN